MLEGLRDLQRCLDALKGLYSRLNARLDARVTAHLKAATADSASAPTTTAGSAPGPAATTTMDSASATTTTPAAAPAARAEEQATAAPAADVDTAATAAAAAATAAQWEAARELILREDMEHRAKWLNSHEEVVLDSVEDHIAYALRVSVPNHFPSCPTPASLPHPRP